MQCIPMRKFSPLDSREPLSKNLAGLITNAALRYMFSHNHQTECVLSNSANIRLSPSIGSCCWAETGSASRS